MADKSPMRLERERRGLSRKAVAQELGTTEHHYWHCEMPPFDGPTDVMQKAAEFLGVAPMAQGQAPRADMRPPRGEGTWRCPRCGSTTKQPATATEVGHSCPKKQNTYQKMTLEAVEPEG